MSNKRRTVPPEPATGNNPSHPTPRGVVIGIDTGGTFTDIVFRHERGEGTYKILSTPDDPAKAVLEALDRLFPSTPPERVSYGTTVATNAILERKGPAAALVTTDGFEDVIEIGRQERPLLFELEPVKPAPLIPRRLRFGVRERLRFDGSVEEQPAPSELDDLAARIERTGVESVAVCFLHAHTNGKHERIVARVLKAHGLMVSTSHELCPEAGEYERTTTVAANAVVRPIVTRHLTRLARDTHARTFRVMQSNGGTIGAATAAREPVRTMLSGPAGGVTEAALRARRAGFPRVITLDMGGTSTDVAFVDVDVPRRPVTVIGGLPIRTPSIDIHTVGAGGGSIADVDPGGSLRVGPRSAGADPGPACYGRGAVPTVTDANCVLGRLRPEAFLGGEMTLDTDRARAAMSRLARRMGGSSVEQAAEGVVRVVEGTMERAMRVMTVERGQDPRSCVLVSFGGAAGLHACGLADALGITTVLIPPDAGVLSAWGVLAGPVLRDRMTALRLVDPPYHRLVRIADALVARARKEVAAEGFPKSRIRIARFMKVRYQGQAIAIEIPLGRGYRRAFHEEHHRLFHTADKERSIEVVGLRVTATGTGKDERVGTFPESPVRRIDCRTTIRAYVADRWRSVPVVARASLGRSTRIDGPAVVTEYSSTAFLAPGWTSRVDAQDNLILYRARALRTRQDQ